MCQKGPKNVEKATHLVETVFLEKKMAWLIRNISRPLIWRKKMVSV